MTETTENLKDPTILSNDIEAVDTAVVEWVRSLNLHATTNRGFRQVPVRWVVGERVRSSKDAQLRDKAGSLILPIITVERTSFRKDMSYKGTAQAGALREITISKQIQQKKTANFENAVVQRRYGQLNFRTRKEPQKTVYKTITIPLPVYAEMMYTISLRTEYQQQMNELMQPFATLPSGINEIIIGDEGRQFEAFVQDDFSSENKTANMDSQERNYKTEIKLKVLGYLIGEGKNQDRPKIVVKENAVEIAIQRERVVFGDESPFTTTGKYRE